MDTTLAARFRMILEEQRLKQTELAEALGVSANYISLLARGKKRRYPRPSPSWWKPCTAIPPNGS